MPPKNFRRSPGGKAFTYSNTSFAPIVEKYHGPGAQRKFGGLPQSEHSSAIRRLAPKRRVALCATREVVSQA
jgi:hypothetical protein